MQRQMWSFWSLCSSAIALGATLLTGCFSINNSYVRAVNASPGLTSETVYAGVIGVAPGLQYGEASNSGADYSAVGAGAAQPITVNKGATVLAQVTQTLLKNAGYTAIIVGPAAGPSLILATDNDAAPTSGDFKWRLVDTSSAAGPIDIYLTPVGGSLNGANAVQSGLQFGQVSAYFQLAPGNDEIQITQAGNKVTTLQTATFAPASGNINTTFFLDPPSTTSTTYGILTIQDPVVATGATPPSK